MERQLLIRSSSIKSVSESGSDGILPYLSWSVPEIASYFYVAESFRQNPLIRYVRRSGCFAAKPAGVA